MLKRLLKSITKKKKRIPFGYEDCPESGYGTYNHEVALHKKFATISYSGEFKDYKPNGKGVMKISTGVQLLGNFKDGKLNGEGSIEYSDGTVYKGSFLDGKRHGFGMLISFDLSTYEGEFRNGRRTGHGKVKLSDGTEYEGDFHNGECYGFGVKKCISGDIYIGEFLNGDTGSALSWNDPLNYKRILLSEYNGEGILISKEGKIYKGIFKNNIYLNPQELTNTLFEKTKHKQLIGTLIYSREYSTPNEKSSKQLETEINPNKIYIPSNDMIIFFQENFVDPIKDDIRNTITDWYNAPLGYDKDFLINDVLERGKTDFDIDYNYELSASDKTNLYCYYNLRKHFFTALHVLEHLENLNELLQNNVIIVDVGCGPGTIFFALIEHLNNSNMNVAKLDYFGYDISKQMCTKGQKLTEALGNITNKVGTSQFYSDWNELMTKIATVQDTHTLIFNTSYLFASESLELDVLQKRFIKIQEALNIPTTYFINQNSSFDDRNKKFYDFISLFNDFECIMDQPAYIEYKTKNNSFQPSNEEFEFQIIKL